MNYLGFIKCNSFIQINKLLTRIQVLILKKKEESRADFFLDKQMNNSKRCKILLKALERFYQECHNIRDLMDISMDRIC